ITLEHKKVIRSVKVIATANTEEKFDLDKSKGSDNLIEYTKENWENELDTITKGKGVELSLEMVGGSIFHKTRKSLAEFGRMVIFGVASGEQAKFHPASLMGKNQSVVGFFLPQII